MSKYITFHAVAVLLWLCLFAVMHAMLEPRPAAVDNRAALAAANLAYQQGLQQGAIDAAGRCWGFMPPGYTPRNYTRK